MKRIMGLLLAAALLLAGCTYQAGSATPDAAPVETFEVMPTQAPTAAPTQPPTEPPSLGELAQRKFDHILNGSLSDFALLDDIRALNQMNGMQAACEALALTCALNHFGYELDDDDIVDDYLEYSSDFVTGYSGNPRRFYEGSGIYPPGLVKTAWNFIGENNAPLYPFDTTGLTLGELYRFVNAGCPHCVCLFGYHFGDNEVKIADSWGGTEKWEDAERFEKIYDEVGQFSVVLMDVSDLTTKR